MLKLMYITDNPDIAVIAQNAGVDRIFVDMEYIGKSERQRMMDTVQNHHTVEDIINIRKVIDKSELIVRVNPIHDGSKEEIDAVVDAGADIIMLPMWHNAEQAQEFIKLVGGRAKTMLLLENLDAVNDLDRVLRLDGIDEIHIGLNDLHISVGCTFLFQLLADSIVKNITEKIKKSGITYGFGGFGRIGEGILPADYIVSEHYRLGSSIAILSRSFCDLRKYSDLDEIKELFDSGLARLREYEHFLENCDSDYFEQVHLKLCDCVDKIVEEMKNV